VGRALRYDRLRQPRPYVARAQPRASTPAERLFVQIRLRALKSEAEARRRERESGAS
jgi:hypothetical protein